MPGVDIFPDITSADALRQALFSYPPDELEKYDRESRQLILETLMHKAQVLDASVPPYYVGLHANPDEVDRFHERVGFVPLNLLEQVNEAWEASFESLEQYAEFLLTYKTANPSVLLGTSS